MKTGAVVWCWMLLAGGLAFGAELDQRRDRIEAVKAALPDVAAERAAAAARGIPLQVALGDGRTAILVRYRDGRPIYAASANLEAARTISANDVWPGGSVGLALDGTGQIIGMWDEGAARDSHRELVPRVSTAEPLSVVQHSTHVAGTIIAAGIGPALHGMAAEASLIQWDFVDDLNEMATEQLEAEPVALSNHSYTYLSGWQLASFGSCPGDPQWYWLGDVAVSTQEDSRFGLYDDAAATWDALLDASPQYLTVKSIGNDRNQGPDAGTTHCHFEGGELGGWSISSDTHPRDGAAGMGFDSIAGGGGSSKNTLTVGAVHDLSGGYAGPASVQIWASSGWGPTDDGRIKPDVVTNGVLLTSADSSGDAAQVALSGTSMAAGSLTGALALLRQHAEDLEIPLSGASLKGLVIHTADEAGVFIGPDYVHGWGLVDVAGAAQTLSDHAQNQDRLWTATLADGQNWGSEAWSLGEEQIRVTLVWFDPAGLAQDGLSLDPATPALVHQLDLSVEGPNAVALPWVLDPASPAQAATTGLQDRDPVEVVDIPVTAAGRYRVVVGHRGIISGDGQPFSVWSTGFAPGALFIDGFESGDVGAWSAAVP